MFYSTTFTLFRSSYDPESDLHRHIKSSVGDETKPDNSRQGPVDLLGNKYVSPPTTAGLCLDRFYP